MTIEKKDPRRPTFSRLIGDIFTRLREALAGGLIKLRVRPNMLTLLGLLITLAGAVFLALGAGDKIGPRSPADPGCSWYGLWAGIILVFASACDVLDGAVARKSQQTTRLGSYLDSSLDRIADGAIFIGILIYYIYRPDLPRSRIIAVLTVAALLNSQLISYVKARAENLIDNCTVGYWQRSERIAAVLIGLFSGHIATVMLMLAVLPAFTVMRRLLFARQQIKRLDRNQPLLDPQAPLQGIMRLALWRYPRRTWQYDLITTINIAAILLIDLQHLLTI